MAEARLRAELEESKAEIQRQSERLSGGPPTVHKELSLVSFVPKVSGLARRSRLKNFLPVSKGQPI